MGGWGGRRINPRHRTVISSKYTGKVARMGPDIYTASKGRLLVHGIIFRSIPSNWCPLLVPFAKT